MKTFAILGGLSLVGVVGYALYFDYKRRNDVEFRKNLKKQKKEHARLKEEEAKNKEAEMLQKFQKAMEMVKNEKYPGPEEREAYFTAQLQMGDTLMKNEPEKVEEIAACFYKAVKVYPEPADLLMILQKSLPEDIFTLIYSMFMAEAQQDSEKYFQDLTIRFPTVEVKVTEEGKKGVYAKKNINAGDILYMEDPAVTGLSVAAIKSQEFCNYCLNAIEGQAEEQCEQCGTVVYCSEECSRRGQVEFNRSLCPNDPENPAARELTEYCLRENKLYPLLIARFLTKMIFKQVMEEQIRMKDPKKRNKPQPIAPEWEHLERLQSKNWQVDEIAKTETELLKNALRFASPGAEQFLIPERYAAIKSVFMENSIGIHMTDKAFKPSSDTILRSAYDPASIYGAGLYFVTAYVHDSEAPNAEYEFKYPPMNRGSSKLTIPSPKLVLKAAKDIKEGEEIFIAHTFRKADEDLVR